MENTLPKWLEKYQLFPVEWNGVHGWFGIIPVAKIEYNKGQIDGLPANPREWTKDDLEELKASIQETPELTVARGVLAFPDPNAESLVALGGNMRYAAAKSLKEKNVPTFIYPPETPVGKLKEIVIKDNGSWGSWGVDALANEWSDNPLRKWGVPDWVVPGDKPTGAGGSGGAQHQVVNQEDNTDGMTVEKRFAPGSVFVLGNHVLMCGDATKPEHYDALLTAAGVGAVDLALTDPPYGVEAVDSRGICGGNPNGGNLGEIGGLCKTGKLASSSAKPRKYRPIIGDDTTETAEKSVAILMEIAKQHCIFGGNYFTDFLPASRCWVVWDKQNGDDNNFADIEMSWCDADKPARLFAHQWAGAIREGDHAAEGRTRLHPTQKPVGLLATIVEKLFPDAETILDPFAGSGSTLIAAERLGKRCLAMELSPEYCDVILARWERFTGKKAQPLNAGEKAPES